MSSVFFAIFDAIARLASKWLAPTPDVAPVPKPLDPEVERGIEEEKKRRGW